MFKLIKKRERELKKYFYFYLNLYFIIKKNKNKIDAEFVLDLTAINAKPVKQDITYNNLLVTLLVNAPKDSLILD
jgi:hypothetical protein